MVRLFCLVLHLIAIVYPAPAFSLGGEKASAKRDLFRGTPRSALALLAQARLLDIGRTMWSRWLLLFGLVAARLRRGSVGALDPCLLVRPAEAGFCWDSTELVSGGFFVWGDASLLRRGYWLLGVFG